MGDVAQVHLEQGGDWDEAFSVSYRESPTFSRYDVVETLAFVDGMNDEDPWLWIGKLTDGRFAFLTAWCDYTGWG